jgi:signal transduction histidine kinase
MLKVVENFNQARLLNLSVMAYLPASNRPNLTWTLLAQWAVVFTGLYTLSHFHYLVFHSLAEIFSICVAAGIFMVTWNSSRFFDSHYLLFLGIAYLFVGGFDLLHTLAYKGMGVFESADTNLPTQLWLAARFTESASLLVAVLFVERKVYFKATWFIYGVGFFLLALSIFYWQIFPVCFVENVGLTPFKKISEYVIALVLAGGLVGLYLKRERFDQDIFRLMALSIGATIVAELAFSIYIHAYGLFNMLGHYLKIVSFYLIYKAVIANGLIKPQTILFYDLQKSENLLREAQTDLEKRITRRTAELTGSNVKLKAEIKERRHVEKALQTSKEQLQHLSSKLMATQEDERRKIAAELHDRLGHRLWAIKFTVENILAKASHPEAEQSLEALGQILPLVKETVAEIRRLQKNLRPPILDDLGLLATFTWHCREFRTIYADIQIVLAFDLKEEDIPEPLKIILYRITQEALNNIVKHSQADLVELTLAKSDDFLTLRIGDNGIGFAPVKSATATLPGNGLGLISMKERVTFSKGTFRIISGQPTGTTIEAIWRLSDIHFHEPTPQKRPSASAA